MTSTTVPRAGLRAWPRIRSDVAAPTVLAALSVALLATTWLGWGDLRGDAGYDQIAAARTAGGGLPYVDYVYFYGPLVPLLLGGVYSVAGASVAPAIAFGLVLALLAIALTYRLAREIASPAGAAVAGALVATVALTTTNNSYVLAHTAASPLATVLALGAILALVRWRRTGATAAATAAGACVGLAALARPDFGMVLLVSLSLWLAFLICRSQERGQLLRAAAALLMPAIALPLAGYGALLSQVSLDSLLFDNLWPREQIAAAVGSSVRAGAPLTISSGIELAARTLAYGVLCGGLVVLAAGLGRGSRLRRAVWAALLLGAALAVAIAVTHPASVRSRMVDLYGFVPVAAVATVAGIALTHRHRDRWMSAQAEVGLFGALVLAGASVGVYAAFTPYPDTGNAPYLWPFAALLMLWGHTRLLARGSSTTRNLGLAWLAFLALAGACVVVSDARQETVRVSGPGGQLRAGSSDGPAFQAVLDAIARETRPGDPILLAPQLSELYILSERRSPLPQLTLLPGALPRERDEDRAIRRMNRVRLAVTDRTPLTLYGSGPFGTDYDRKIGEWLRREFRLAATVDGTGRIPRTLDIWKRRDP